MRRIAALAVGINMLGFNMVTTITAVDSKKEISVDAANRLS